MQNQLYLTDSYQFKIQTTILACGEDEQGSWIALTDNIFHPQGGGQPADNGFINQIPVSIKKQSDGLIVAYPQTVLNLAIGDQVSAEISASDRCLHAALHTAGHLLNWEMRKYGWMANKGHHFPGESRVEFESMGNDAISASELTAQQIEADIKQQLMANKSIHIHQEADMRLSYIDDTENMPCGGTHVSSLGKIDQFVIKSIKYKKGILRISYDAIHQQ